MTNNESLKNVDLEVVDSRDLGLLVRITKAGECRVSAQVPKPEAIRWLRMIADKWEEEEGRDALAALQAVDARKAAEGVVD